MCKTPFQLDFRTPLYRRLKEDIKLGPRTTPNQGPPDPTKQTLHSADEPTLKMDQTEEPTLEVKYLKDDPCEMPTVKTSYNIIV